MHLGAILLFLLSLSPSDWPNFDALVYCFVLMYQNFPKAKSCVTSFQHVFACKLTTVAIKMNKLYDWLIPMDDMTNNWKCQTMNHPAATDCTTVYRYFMYTCILRDCNGLGRHSLILASRTSFRNPTPGRTRGWKSPGLICVVLTPLEPHYNYTLSIVNRSGDRYRWAIQRGTKDKSVLCKRSSFTAAPPDLELGKSPGFLYFHLWIRPGLDPGLPTWDPPSSVSLG
jgi:hypothetical protein